VIVSGVPEWLKTACGGTTPGCWRKSSSGSAATDEPLETRAGSDGTDVKNFSCEPRFDDEVGEIRSDGEVI